MAEKQREFDYTFEDFNVLRQMSNQHSGILVPDDKFDMFYSRLSKRVRALGFSNFKQYCSYLQQQPEHEFTEFINSVTTNLTSFFREKHHFDFLAQTVLPELLKKNQQNRTVKLWSAGCSTGEEPYTLAMTLRENLPENWTIKILATDLDTNVLATAAQGIYPLDRVSALPKSTLSRWFQRGTGNNGNQVRVKKELRELIRFNQLNLMQDWPMQSHFDFIFCRNVLIYFDKSTKERLANRYAGLLKDGAYLFIGHSESLHQLDTPFQLLGNNIYKKASR